MRSTGVLGDPKEYFNREEKTPTVERCTRIAASATPNGVAATKLFPSHFYELSRDIRLTEWFPDPGWIYLEGAIGSARQFPGQKHRRMVLGPARLLP
ncbi:hypothetical protein NKI88_12150 [Mesorhizobium sp. M0317]